MFYDLHVPFPAPPQPTSSQPSGKGAKGKGKAAAAAAASAGQSAEDKRERDPWAGVNKEDRKGLEERVRMLVHLGYRALAFTHHITSFHPSTHICPFPPSSTHPLFPSLDPRTSPRAPTPILQLTRLLLTLSSSSLGPTTSHNLTSSNAALLAGYDILSVRPLDLPSFTSACLVLGAPTAHAAHIISLDLSAAPRLPFQLKRATVGKALADGVVFEVCYGGALEGGEGRRRNLIAGAREVVRVTGGKGVILSGEVRDAMGLRGPEDVINLGTVFGLNQALARRAISDTCRAVVLRAETRKTYRGVLSAPTLIMPSPNSKRERAEEVQDGMDVDTPAGEGVKEEERNGKGKKARLSFNGGAS